ncbi:MAG TPA: HAMP domain-containing sensor histidine kinase [Xanthomonadales bacterium]|nr:HAMP domain-containing sensor histidine kinase [Xanthomonadales bacterium]
MPRFARSTLDRFALGYGAAFLAAFALLFASAQPALDALVAHDTRRTVEAEVEGLREIRANEGDAGLRRALAQRIAHPIDPAAVYFLLDPAHRLVLGAAQRLPPAMRWRDGWMAWRAPDPEGAVVAYVQRFADGSVLVAGHDEREQERLMRALALVGWCGLALLAGTAVLLGLGLRRSIDAALRGPLDTADRVAAGRLHERVPIAGSDDAFDRLGTTINRMLDRIEQLVDGIRRSTDAIAHDLRTPLTRLRTRLENLRDTTPCDTASAQSDAAIADADRLLATFQSLLRLARIEGGPTPALPVVALDGVAADAVELWQAVAEGAGLRIEAVLEPVTVAGDRDQLFQLVANLLDNAVKYTPAPGRVRVALRSVAAGVELEVADDGPGIPATDRERVFDRFVRLEAHRGTEGSGLGLSLVRAIAVRHGATIALRDAQPGLAVLVRFPRMN